MNSAKYGLRIDVLAPPSNQPVLQVTGLAKQFGPVEAVRGIDLRIDPGETFGLLGPNGAGKSTAIAMITGLLQPDRGTVVVRGRPMTTKTTAVRSEIGLVPQEIAIYPELTARENLRFFGRLYHLAGHTLDDRIAEVLDVIGLVERADDRAKDYSGGMQRRLNIGIALLHRPPLLVLDEPTVGVDPQSRNAILEAIEQLAREGMAMLYTTHYMEEAERLCSRIAIIDQGEIKAEGTRRELTQLVGERDTIHVEVGGPIGDAYPTLIALGGVRDVTVGDGGLDIIADDAGAIVAQVLETLTFQRTSISSVEIRQPDLEAVFLHLTGKALRD